MLLNEVKLALGITSSAFDEEINTLISSAIIDLNISGVDSSAIVETTENPLIKRAIILYSCYHFELEHGNLQRAEELKKSYDEIKSQMSMATGYTTGGEFDAT